MLISIERKTLEGVNGWVTTAFEITRGEGRSYLGVLSFEHPSSGQHVNLNWKATYNGEGQWYIEDRISGTAILHNLRTVNEAVREAVAQGLNTYLTSKKKGGKLAPPQAVPITNNSEETPTKRGSVPTTGADAREKRETSEAANQQLVRVKVRRIRPFANQPRKYFNEDTLGALADSLVQDGQQSPVIVIPVVGDAEYDYELVDGERRWRAAQIAGMEELDAVVKANIKDAFAQHLSSTIHNFHRDGHSPMEISNALKVQMDGGKTAAQLAVAFGKSTAWVYQHLALQRLAKPLQTFLEPPTPQADRLRLQIAKLFLRLPIDRQEAVYQNVCKERNPRLQYLKTKEFVEAAIDITARKKRAPKPADHVKWLETCVERLEGDTARASLFTPAVFASLVQHRERSEIEALLKKIEAAQSVLTRLVASITRVREALGR